MLSFCLTGKDLQWHIFLCPTTNAALMLEVTSAPFNEQVMDRDSPALVAYTPPSVVLPTT
ncbi:hypothetical protein GCM10011572_50560 [Pseudoduganella buxea]|uniref:Uncharacterized protein n=1 Tax=Pseudoduganella buxea TaxID=1949069 RepID=A0ABQ1LFD1_9BURK|nr:hypothetical protein GCM10011572_50560 [Pseudoduganella buxea]